MEGLLSTGPTPSSFLIDYLCISILVYLYTYVIVTLCTYKVVYLLLHLHLVNPGLIWVTWDKKEIILEV